METLPVLISINVNAHREDAQAEPMAMLVSGQMSLEKDRVVLDYEEVMDDDEPPKPVELVFSGKTVSMARGGDYETSMVFCKGRRFEGQYHTPFGVMGIAVYCTRLNYTLNRDGGDLSLSYQLDINGQFQAVHDMQLRVVTQNG